MSAVTMRVWLSEWEWACCGTPFQVGDDVELLVGPRSSWVEAVLADELATTVDAVESHHDEPGPDRLVGRVVALHAVTQEIRNRRVARDPARPGPMQSRLRLSTTDADGETAWAAAPPSPYYVQGVSVDGTARLASIDRVPRRPVEPSADAGARLAAAVRGEGPAEWSSRSLAGYLVDIDPAASD